MAMVTINIFTGIRFLTDYNKQQVTLGLAVVPCYMQEWERKWPPIMTIGHVFHRGPVESGPWFTVVQQECRKTSFFHLHGDEV